MRVLSDAELLGLWERGARRHPLDRALLTLAAAFPELPSEHLADWPIGRRNQALAEVRCGCFGHRLRAWTACVACGEKLELELDGRLLANAQTGDPGRAGEPVILGDRTFRLPTSRDLARSVQEGDPVAGAARIAENCLVNQNPPDAWSEAELCELGDRLASADPCAETLLSLHCPECGSDWQATLDLASFLWTEIEARVRQVLSGIHVLASAYGWSEAEILSLSNHRRAMYLEMAQS